MQTATELPRVSLYYREGSSDKVYQCRIDPAGERFMVNFAYGRRGSTLNTGTKTNVPVDFDAALRIYEKLVREKQAKGYTEGENGTPYQHSSNEKRTTGSQCQLLNPIDEDEVERLIEDPKWCAQEKFDGKRILIQKEGAEVQGINRKGLLVGLPASLVSAASDYKQDFILDGECIGDHFHVFDILSLNGEDICKKPFEERAAVLLTLLFSGQQRFIHPVNTAWRRAEKEVLLDSLTEQAKEGVVFKRIDAPYLPGRPSSGGTQLKHKFYSTASFVVAGTNNGKRSIRLVLFDRVQQREAGNVTIPPNHQMPLLGEVVEVRYLYAFKESGSVYQPVYLGVRADISITECTTAQLKFKSQEEDEPCL